MSGVGSEGIDVLVVESGILRVEISYAGKTGWALAHNQVPVIKNILATNTSDSEASEPAHLDLSARIGADSLFDLTVPLPELRPGKATPVAPRFLAHTRLDPSTPLLQATESQPGTLEAHLRTEGNSAAGYARADIRILAPNEWFHAPAYFESLAAFAQPNAPQIPALVRKVSDLLKEATGDASVQGYQAGIERVLQIMSAVYAVLAAEDIRYVTPPASFENTGQRIRTTEEVLTAKAGTCIDLVLTYAALAQSCGLLPVIILVPGHALVGIASTEDGLREPVITEPASINNYLRSGAVLALDAAFYDAALSFPDNLNRTKAKLTDGTVLALIGLAESHRDGLRPLPTQAPPATALPNASSTASATAEAEAATAAPHTHSPAADIRAAGKLAQQLAGEDSADYLTLDTSDAAPARVQRWKRELLDLTLRNRLLNIKPAKEVLEFEVRAGMLADIDDRISRGDRITMRAQDDLSDNRFLRGTTDVSDLSDAEVSDELSERGILFGHVTEYRYAEFFKNLARTTKTLAEETGSANLYLMLGTMRYTSKNGKDASAPLFLLPVRLGGGSGRSRFTIQADNSAEATPNHSLVEWLHQEHGVHITALSEPKLDASGLDIDYALREISAALVRENLPFTVTRDVYLGIAKFSTFGMWRDLRDHWDIFMESPVFEHLTLRPGESFVEPGDLPPIEQVTPNEAELNLPIPADGAQMRVVSAAGQGYSFVVEGPPGTGKSQTITNILAHLLEQGKRVLFVAEKQAALDVVKTRMERIGLAPFILDLHGGEQRPQAIRDQLRGAIDASVHYDMHRWDNARALLRSHLEPLAAYPALVHGMNAAGHSLWSAVTASLDLGEGAVAIVPQRFVTDPNARATIATIDEALPNIAVRARSTDLAAMAAWQLVGPYHAPLPELIQAFDGLAAMAAQCERYPELADTLESVPLSDVRKALDGTSPLLDPDEARQLASSTWKIATVADKLSRLAPELEFFTDIFSPAFFAYGDTSALTRALDELAEGGFFGKKKRVAAYRSALIPALPAGREPDIEGKHSPDTVRAALGRLSYMRRALADLETELENIPGARQRVSVALSDPSAPAALAEAADSLQRSLELSTRFPALVELTRRAGSLDDARAALDIISSTWDAWATAANLQLPSENRWMSVFREWYPRWSAAGRDSLAAAVEWHRATAILRKNGLEEFQHQIEMGEVPDRDISLAFRRGVASTSAEERMRAFSGHISLSEQNSSDLTRLQEAFATIQGEATQALPATLMARRSFRPGELHGKVGTLRRNLDRKRGARSFRSLLEEFTEEILEATPCFFASPASLATFVDPTAVVFDVVIFDEASQITVDQAMGAIGRAKAVIISGDSRQMPPTRFGKTGPFSGDDEDLDDPDRPLVETVVSDLESILSEAVESGLPRLWLSWHYRSRDESLIAFSNEAYYEGKLSSFPSPGNAALFGGAGVSMRRVSGTFDRSRGATFRTNRVEAEEIVRDIHRRLNSPALAHQSIGVVTFNIQQRNLILDLLEDSRDPLIRAAMEQEKDPLFVKNLENVQGDERDVIIFSTAFSPREPGGPLPLNFGPLSREGGERRFNVAITRARSEVLVVTSFDPEDIDLNRTRSRGMQDLREYMLRARARTQNDGAAPALADSAAEGSSALPRALSINDNPVRDRLMHELRERGWEVEGDYGLSSYTLDIVVREPGSKVWLLAVMFDDEKWSSLPTVTDRDITPQLLTSMMGWLAVERVWLPELRRDPDGVIDRIDASARKAKERYAAEERKAEKRQERAAKKLAGRKAKLARAAAADGDAAPSEELTPAPESSRAPVSNHKDPDAESALTWREVPSAHRNTHTKAKRAAEPAQHGTQEDPQPTPQSAPQPKRSTIRVALKPATPENPTDTSEERWRFGEAWEKHGTKPGESVRHISESVDDWGTDIPPCPAPLTLPDTSPLGSREELEFPMSTARTAEVREAVREMIEESAPLPLQSLRVAIVKRFGRQRTSEKVNKILDTFIPQDQIFVDDSDGQEFVWPEDVYPENWHYYRPYPGRGINEIPLREIYNMARVLVDKYPEEYRWGEYPDEDFVRRILKEFSLLRLSPDSQARVSEAVLLYGNEHRD